MTAIAPTLDASPSAIGPGALLAGDLALPLAGVKARARICADGARTVIEQRFHNSYPESLEATYVFPLAPRAAVIRFELRVGERRVRGVCQERKAAEQAYDAAIQRGQRAALLTQERGDAYTMKVGNIPSGAIVHVELEILERLAEQDGALRWRFPTVIAPRYMPGAPVSHAGPGVHPDTDQVPDASRLSPPLLLAGGAPLDLEVRVDWLPRRIASSLHAIQLELDGGVRVAPAGQAKLDRDFLLELTPPAPSEARLEAWTDGLATAVRVLPPTVVSKRLPREAIFLIDISGSMEGTKLDAARQALRLALRSLEAGDLFQIIAFDDRLDRFAPHPVEFTSGNLQRADAWVQRLHSRGGTEIAPALAAGFAPSDVPTGMPRVRTVMMITDAQVGNDEALIRLIRQDRRGALLFTVGIDTAVHGGLLERMARAGGGTCTLLTPHDDIELAISKIEARFGAPLAGGLAVKGGEDARPEPFPLFAGCPEVRLLLGTPDLVSVPGLELTATPRRVDFPLGTLWARERIDWLEDDSAAHPERKPGNDAHILRLALDHSLSSRLTAWVAIDEAIVSDGTRRSVVQPVSLPADWAMPGGGFGGGGGGVPYPASAPAGMPLPSAPPPVRRPAPLAAAPAASSAGPADRRAYLADDEAPAEEALDDLALGYSGPQAQEADGDFEVEEEAAPRELERSVRRRSGASLPASTALPSESPPAPKRSASLKEKVAGLFQRDSAKGRADAPGGRAEKADKAASAARSSRTLGDLLLQQAADGSWGQDPDRTAAALLALVLSGHTRLSGARRRAVQKAAAWLAGRPGARGAAVLAALERAEQGGAPHSGLDVAEILAAGGVDAGLIEA